MEKNTTQNTKKKNLVPVNKEKSIADLAVDAFLHSISENQHIEGLIQHPHHHGLRVQRATVL